MDDALAVLLLPAPLETFAYAGQARGLLTIPRVVALEPSRVPTPRFMREAMAARQASRLQLPGELRAVILYHPAQYSLARALCGRHERAELWYLAPDLNGGHDEELLSMDELARERAVGVLPIDGQDHDALRVRLSELEVISHRPFVPSVRFARRRTGKGSRGLR